MSKRRNRHLETTPSATSPRLASNSMTAEYKFIKTDIIRLVVWNVILLAAVLTLYYTNLQSHYLDNWFAKILHF